jgi:hypothetical protein
VLGDTELTGAVQVALERMRAKQQAQAEARILRQGAARRAQQEQQLALRSAASEAKAASERASIVAVEARILARKQADEEVRPATQLLATSSSCACAV